MKIVLMGNAGAGKSTMSRQLVGDRDVAVLSLDEIAWEAGTTRRPHAESVALLKTFIQQNESWIIEGCYGDLIEAALPYCDELRFLNPGVAVCVDHCQRRPWEPSKFETPEAQQAALGTLIEWVKDYETRTDEYGLQRHRRIFDAFEGRKREYQKPEAYADAR